MTTPSKASQRMVPADQPECPCAACDPGMMLDGEYTPFPSRMNVCPDCGNKRCPKAANHATWQCSGSNTVGQVGVHAARPAAPTVPATLPVGVGTSGVGTGAPGGAGEVGLGDAIRANLVTRPHRDPELRVGALADRADVLERERAEFEAWGERCAEANLRAFETIQRVRDLADDWESRDRRGGYTPLTPAWAANALRAALDGAQ